jgi:hypothetical protein
MLLEQTENTKKFIVMVKALLDKGTIRKMVDLVDALDWNNTMLSNVMNGRKNVPSDIYRKFTELYPPNTHELDYRDKYIAQLEQQVAQLEKQLAYNQDVLSGKIDALSKPVTGIEQVIDKAMKNQLLFHAVQAAFRDMILELAAKHTGGSLEDMNEILGHKAAAYLQKRKQEGIFPG